MRKGEVETKVKKLGGSGTRPGFARVIAGEHRATMANVRAIFLLSRLEKNRNKSGVESLNLLSERRGFLGPCESFKTI